MSENAVAPQRFKRRRKLIQPGLQMRLTLAFLTTSLTCLCLQGFYLLQSITRQAPSLPVGRPDRVAELLAEEIWVGVAISLAILVPLTIGVGILVTFRVAGPAYRFEQYLRSIARGEDPGPCRLRHRDELQNVCDAINAAVSRMRQNDDAESTPGDARPIESNAGAPEDRDSESNLVSQRGFTLLEVTVVLAIGAVFTVGLLTAFVRLQAAQAENQAMHELELRAHRALDRMVYLCRQAVSDQPDFAGLSNISGDEFRGFKFAEVTSFSGGSPVYDSSHAIHLIGAIPNDCSGVVLGRGVDLDAIVDDAAGKDGLLGTDDDVTVIDSNGDRVAETLVPSRFTPRTGEILVIGIDDTLLTISLRLNEQLSDGTFRFAEDVSFAERVALRQ